MGNLCTDTPASVLLSTRDGSVYGNNVDSELSAVRLRSAAAGGDL